jgi:hypothetical protein
MADTMTDMEPYVPEWVATLQPAWELARRLERAAEFIPKEFSNRAEAIMATILTGAELGRGPMWALRSMHVINGRPGLSAEAMRALVLAAGHDIWVTEHSDHQVTICGRRKNSDRTTEITWTAAQAEKAGLRRNAVWNSYPRAMLTARATAELCRLVFSDVIAGIAPLEELEDGYPLEPKPEIPSPPVRRRRQPATPPPPPAAEDGPTGEVPAVHPSQSGPSAPPLPPLPSELLGDTLTIDAGTKAAMEGATVAELRQMIPTYTDAPPTPPEDAYGPPRAVSGDPGPDLGDEPPAATDEDAARRKLMALTRDAFPNMRTSQRELFRHALTALATRDRLDGPIVSSRLLTVGEQLTLTNLLGDIRTGALLPALEDDGAVVFSSNTKNAVIRTDENGRWTVDIQPR